MANNSYASATRALFNVPDDCGYCMRYGCPHCQDAINDEHRQMDGESVQATPHDAIREYASNAGSDPSQNQRQWIEHPSFADVYVENPHYSGPNQPHPLSDY